jgi:hypothetical protein
MRRAWCYEFPSQGPFPDADSSGFLGVPDSIDEDEAVFDSDLFEQHVRHRRWHSPENSEADTSKLSC